MSHFFFFFYRKVIRIVYVMLIVAIKNLGVCLGNLNLFLEKSVI